ncbi:MAG: hypothetical protein JXR78_15225 [Victivallales bacterium]|nr:hypothetical protein [Victivallales bacterium]
MSYNFNPVNPKEILRDGVPVAIITGENTVEAVNEELGKYLPHAIKLLKDHDAYNADNKLVLIDKLPTVEELQEQERLEQERLEQEQSGKLDTIPDVLATVGKISTTRQLVDAMQLITDEPCPAMTRWEGDQTPAVVDWIKRHDKQRVMVLKASQALKEGV